MDHMSLSPNAPCCVDNTQEEDIVEMCAGWAMIPIVASLRDTVRKKQITMYGGTPFSVVHINRKVYIVPI